MAEACRLGHYNTERKCTSAQDENYCIFHVLTVFISLVTILADLTTDILVFAEYCKDGFLYWALATIIFIITPNVLVNIFSMRWHLIEQERGVKYWIIHGCLVGLLDRYIRFLRKVFTCKNFESIKTQKLISQRNDLCLLHFLYIFTGTVPQVILQTYAIIIFDGNYHTKVFALTASVTSIIWGCATYIYSVTAFSNENLQLSTILLKIVWHFGMLIGRISAILLFTILFGVWTLVPLGLHWSVMTFWIIIQKTTFCPNKLEETLYNVVMGFVYCFCYINLREGNTRYRLIWFYTLMITQNFGSLLIYILMSDVQWQKKPWSIAATSCVIVGTLIGICAMILYYRYFHTKGPIVWNKSNNDIELNNKSATHKTLNYVRSFKSTKKSQSTETDTRKQILSSEQIQQSEVKNADKKFLLEHWIARSGTPTFCSAPVGNNSMDVSSIEFHTVENTPQSINMQREGQDSNITTPCNDKINTKSRMNRICSPTELTLKLSTLKNLESSIDEITSNNFNLQKRRGICSSDEFRDGLTNLNLEVCNIINGNFAKTIKTDHSSEISHDTDGSNKKTSSDSIDMDLDLSFSDINSSDINTFNENIVQKLCLSALKNIKVGNQDADIENIQRMALDILKEMYAKKGKSKSGNIADSFSKSRDLDTPTEILSVHDYENICAVNIAREAWGLRSWNGYFDIENWLHDGSVFRDRRRDTLTSASTEISSCISQELKNAILSAPPFPKKSHTYSNVFVKFDRSNQEDYDDATIGLSSDETFLAKPCVIDNGKDLNHLEPIIEELDDLGDIDLISKKRLNSESSLVATIDEIRKATVTNSPKDFSRAPSGAKSLHNRRELSWDSPQVIEPGKLESNIKKALWKEPSKYNSSNIMESLPEKENILNVSHESKFDLSKKGSNISILPNSLNHNITNIPSCNKNSRHQKSNSNLRNPIKRNNKSEQLQDLLNKDIDLLWHLVSENALPLSSTEDLSSNKMSSSLQSLIQKDTSADCVNTSTSKLSNIKKGTRSKPRRKFSILRERFEPRTSISSDKEVLCNHSENTSRSSESNFVNVKNQLDINDKTEVISQQKQTNLSSNDVKTNNSVLNEVESIASKNIKEKRSLFMKQVLSPPKFNTKLKHFYS